VTLSENLQTGAENVLLALERVSCGQYHRVPCYAKVKKKTTKILSLELENISVV
jgi:hypothetical protein